jgi:nitroreductase
VSNKKADTQAVIDNLISQRWSPRAFDVERPIEEEKITAILEAARWAPSCFNDQPWRYVICNKTNNEAAWKNALACLVEKNQLWAKNAPVLMLACANDKFGYNGSDNRWSQYDTGAASENICLQATSLGLFVHQMGGFDPDRARKVFKIPEGITPMAMMAMGYMGELSSLHEDFVEGEQAERSRKAISESFFNGEWGSPYTGV